MGLLFFLLETLSFLNKKGQIKYNALNMCNHENKKSSNRTLTLSITDTIASV